MRSEWNRAAHVDPIIAAIARHRELWQAFEAACHRTDSVLAEQQGREVTQDDEVTNDAEEIALDKLLANSAHDESRGAGGARASDQIRPGMRSARAVGAFAATLLLSRVLADLEA